MHFLWRGFLIFILTIPSLGGAVVVTGNQESGICQNGAMVHKEYCRFFIYYRNAKADKLDIRISDALQIPDQDASKTRAIGLIIAISKYPALNANLEAAEVDGKRLANFLIYGQKFDEVILLKDQDATAENIDYFLQDYLPARGEMFNKKARLLIAYSGHGRFGTQDGLSSKQPAFVLSHASDIDGSKGMYGMPALNDQLNLLSKRYFHVLTLVNACFGAGLYGMTTGAGNSNAYSKPGAIAIAAGDNKTEVYSLNKEKGSVFFDLIINGVTSGVADERYGKSYMVKVNGKKEFYAGITRTLSLFVYLNDRYIDVNQELVDRGQTLRLSDAWIGHTEEQVGPGGFFFINEPSSTSLDATTQTAVRNDGEFTNLDATPFSADVIKPVSTPAPPPVNENAIEIPYGPVSAIPHRPDIRIFKAPDIYPIKGHDISAADGEIDWNTLKKESKARFIYTRVVGWKGYDSSFKSNWQNLKNSQFDRGAYLKYDFCRSPESQLDTAKQYLNNDPAMLPVGILLVHPAGEDRQQLACFEKGGMNRARQNILIFAELVKNHYRKTPIFYGNHNNLSNFLDSRFDSYMIWMGFWGKTSVKLGGSNPWTLWQYSGNEEVPGIGPQTESEVFFGTEDQYQQFRQGSTNIALSAVK
ncbi:caspase family protein [Atlantibacter subterranea]|uniref:GH25 family lysozyme n=1 Tax=Atlantibacter subterraneus TaxID=255519 RepID=UPI0020C38861|nr:GH25 family lysozyme [Atlantibacter subterranea]UTJ45429.1 caspase family protein [Atlantibacter subterranea]